MRVVHVAVVAFATTCLVLVAVKSVSAIGAGQWWVAVVATIGLGWHGAVAAGVLSMCRVAAAAATGDQLDVARLAKAGRRFARVLALTIPSLVFLLIAALYPFVEPDTLSSVVVQIVVIGQVLLGGVIATLAERAADGPGWTPWRIGRRR